MKKSLLLGSALLVGIGAFAQTNRQALGRKFYKGVSFARIDNSAMANAPLKPVSQNSTQVTSVGFTASQNGFGMLVEETVPLSYNPDLNMVAFTMRIPPATGTYSYSTSGLPTLGGNSAGVSGYMITHSTIDNGSTWTRRSLYAKGSTTVNGARARYPSGVIANSPGNTNPANAFFVGTGPCTDGNGWMASWFASRPANQTGNSTTNDQQVPLAAAGSGTIADGTYFPSFCTTTRGTEVWSGSYLMDAAENIVGCTVYKGVPNAGAYVWSRPLDAMLNNSVDSSNFSSPKIAFSPDGMIGYIVVNGVWKTNTGNAAKSYNPQVFKTTDGGATWNKVNHNYDWKTNHPEIMGNLIPTAYDGCWDGTGINKKYPAFFDTHGGEITVDNTGKLHYVTTVVSAYSSHRDSMGYGYGQAGYSYVHNDPIDRPWVWDFTTDGNGTWDAKFISHLYTRNIADDEVVGTDAFWTTDGSASMDYSNRIKVSRTADGTKIFMTWTDSDTNVVVPVPASGTTPAYDTYQPNHTPSIFYRALDAATGMLTPTLEASYFDAVENAFYLYQTSEIVMPSANGFTIPTIYISSSDGSQNATNAVDYSYIIDMEIDNSTYNVSQAMNVAPVTTTAFVSDSDTITTLAVATTFVDALCNGVCNGTATATGSGSTLPAVASPVYKYTWSNGQTTAAANGLCAGTEYIVTMRDKNGNGCWAFDTVVVSEPAAIVVNSTPTNPTCGNADGSIAASASGGTGAFTYAWDAAASSQTTATATGLDAGSYQVVVTDANSCKDSVTVALSNAGAPTVAPTSSNVSCFGACDGSITANATGGTGALTYAWTGGLAAADAVTSVCAGTYTLQVTDAANCASVSVYNVTEPAEINIGVAISGFGVILTSQATGATYQWIDCGNGNTPISGATNATYTATANGTYAVDVTVGGCTSRSACLAVTTVGVKDIASNIESVSQNMPNPFNATSVVLVNLKKAENVSLVVTNSIGQVVSTQSVRGVVGANELTIDATNLESGIYFYTVVAGTSKVTRKMSVVK